MLRNNLVRCCSRAAVALFVLIPSSAAVANDGTGGAAAVERPEVEQVACAAAGGTCAPGAVLEVTGGGLDTADAVIFKGGRSRFDDRRAKPQVKKFHSLTVKVPKGAKSGPVLVDTRRAGRSAPTPPVQVLSAAAKPAAQLAAPASPGAGVFPIQAAHDYGTEVNRFGGGRGHKGQDVFAKCGTPLVAALSGVVTMAKFQERAGNYAVITADDGTSQAYMHMRQAALVKKGDRVEAGQPVGEVGDTGRASGCHLHFELWTAPGWYEGGEPIDPLPLLRKLDTGA